MQKHVHSILNDERIGMLLFKLSLPAFFGMFVMTLYNVVNTIFVGRYVGTLGIAGLSVVFPLQMLTMGFGMMVGIGGASLISRRLGTGDITDAERTIGNGITLSVVLYAFVCILILPFADSWLKLIGASEAVLPYARDYLVIIVLGSIFGILSMALLTFARAEGNARVGMTAMILSALLSILLSALFIIPLNLGVPGAALATIIAQAVSLIYLLLYYLGGRSYLKIRIGNLVPDLKILKPMFSIGITAFVQTVANSVSAMILISTVVSYGGDYALSAYGILQRIMMFGVMPAMVIGQGAQPILGFNYTSHRYDLTLKAIKLSVFAATIMSVLVFLVVYFIPEPLMRIFSRDPELLAIGTYGAKRIFLAMPLMGMVMVSTQIFQALGKAVPAFISAIVRPVVFLIPLIIMLPRFWQLDGVWLSFPFSDILTCILIVLLLTPLIRNLSKAIGKEKEDYYPPVSVEPQLEPGNIGH